RGEVHGASTPPVVTSVAPRPQSPVPRAPPPESPCSPAGAFLCCDRQGYLPTPWVQARARSERELTGCRTRRRRSHHPAGRSPRSSTCHRNGNLCVAENFRRRRKLLQLTSRSQSLRPAPGGAAVATIPINFEGQG